MTRAVVEIVSEAILLGERAITPSHELRSAVAVETQRPRTYFNSIDMPLTSIQARTQRLLEASGEPEHRNEA